MDYTTTCTAQAEWGTAYCLLEEGAGYNQGYIQLLRHQSHRSRRDLLLFWLWSSPKISKLAISPASTLHQLSSFSSFSGLVIQCVSKLVNPDVAASPSTILDQLETHLDIISPDVACPGKASTPLQR